MIATTYRLSSRVWVQQSLKLFQKLVRSLREIFSLAWAVFCISCSLLERLYRICKRPIAHLIAALLCTLLLLNVFASGYTICTGNFLDTFCPKQLPRLRNYLCSHWDDAQASHRDLGAVKSTVKLPYARYLQDEDSTLSYNPPHALSLWEQGIRSFRASIAESEYPLMEQERFYQEFSVYIEQGVRATSNAHKGYAHMVSTITHHTSNTRWLLQQLRAEGPLDNITLYVNGPLARSMDVLSTYGIVYLLNGLQPFQQNMQQQSVRNAVELMKSYVGEVVTRLEDDVAMINALQQSLKDLAVALDDIKTHTSQLWRNTQRASVAIQPQWWQLFSNTLEYRLDKYTVDRQAFWLGALRDGVGLYSDKLHMMADEFQAATLSCHHFQEHLIPEGEAVRSGWKVSDLIDKQAEDLENGFVNVRFQLQNFKEEKIRFDEKVSSR